jgi:SAM-dependent methyltransferase
MSTLNIVDANKIKQLFKSGSPTGEFEFIFFSRQGGIPYEKYITLLKFLNKRASLDEKLKLERETSLDINYSPDRAVTYRITLYSDDIDKYMRNLSTAPNHMAFKRLLQESQKDKNISVIKKSKNTDSTIDVDDLNLRIRLSDELNLTQEEFTMLSKMNNKAIDNINFRFKTRTSLFLVLNESDYVKTDLTITKTENIYNKLNNSIKNYELEIESKSGNANEKLLDIMYTEADKLLKVIQQSNFIITNSVSQKVIENYKNLLSVPKANDRLLYGRQPVSLEIQYVESLANKYAVTDKADGERHFLIITDNHVYLINKNLGVRDTGIVLKGEQQKFNNSVLDGELIFLKGRHAFLVFDCLFEAGIDVRKEIKLENRLRSADRIIKSCFIFGSQRGNDYVPLPKDKQFNLQSNLKFHRSEIKRMFDDLNHDIEIEKQFVLVRRKYFIHSLGALSWEIYSYASLIWNAYTESKDINCPYTLDGLIFQPNDQSYVTNKKDSQFEDFKWKPPEKNSIDFYIEFLKDNEGKDVIVYDNSFDEVPDDPDAETTAEDRLHNKSYKICRLFVGKLAGRNQVPTLFREQDGLNEAYIPLKDGEARDEEGNILTDKTVVEFYYNFDSTLSYKFKWIPLKTRYDKTESVIKYKMYYGNFVNVAERVWQSIINPVLITDFIDLAKGNDPERNVYLYDKKMESIRRKITHEQIVSASKENVYFQQNTKLAQPMKSFHNFIKSNLIYTFCHSMYQDNKQKSILDFGCGRGQDINKFYYAKAAFYVGIDFDKDALTNPLRSAMSVYERERRKPGFTKMFFIHGDFTNELDYENQFKSIGGMEESNKQLIDRFFSKNPQKRTIFDVINIQFAVHYAFKNEQTFRNLKNNINNYLRDDGFVLITTFDGTRVRNLLEGRDNFTQEYTDSDGNVKTLFDIRKKYSDSSPQGLGNAIDVHMSWISFEGVYLTEYLVEKDFIIEEFKKDCNLELVTTDLFENQFNLYRDYLTKYYVYEAEERTRRNLEKFGELYKPGSVNDASRVYTNLERFYVFRKSTTSVKVSDKNKKGGNLADTKQFVIEGGHDFDTDYSFLNSIHHVLKNENVIPKSIDPKSFCSNMDIKYVNDLDIDENIENICKSIVVFHQVEGKKPKKILDGLCILVTERDCNNEYDTKLINDSADQCIILNKEGSVYAPMYAVQENGKRKGIFNTTSRVIQDILNQKN